ncbi:two-component system chemotaxis response regulator CheB [Pseudomonas graminis]|uniref:chemotaxis protein CheB n=1 Tax=Pseudomonas graminis TaxID=158627 RepID=UPI001061D433|nr:chemotaxis protein CheB [Pseudomonas graminis]TDV54724.1 two-component system chemotaxis response regulator CheB [Pseudomonas graminis]
MDAHNTEVLRDVVVIGGSQGAMEALRVLLTRLPAHFPAAVLIVIHTHSSGPDYMASVLSRYSTLPVAYGEEGEPVLPGRVYLAPPDRHMEIVSPGIIHLDDGPKVKLARPAADRLFATAADVFRERVISLVLSGGDSDGADGAVEVRNAGGLSFVQRPEEAPVPSMPIETMRKTLLSPQLSAEEMADALIKAVGSVHS